MKTLLLGFCYIVNISKRLEFFIIQHHCLKILQTFQIMCSDKQLYFMLVYAFQQNFLHQFMSTVVQTILAFHFHEPVTNRKHLFRQTVGTIAKRKHTHLGLILKVKPF